MMSTPHSSPVITSVLNFNNAKTFAFSIMLCFSIYHGFSMLIKPGGSLCKSLLSDGLVSATGEWRPFGCMTHMYTNKHAEQCIKRLSQTNNGTRFYFVGDSRLLSLFNSFAKHLDRTSEPSSTASLSTVIKPNSTAWNTTVSAPIVYRDALVTLCFFRQDELDDQAISLLDSWTTGPSSSSLRNHSKHNVSIGACPRQAPTHLILSMGTETIRRFNLSDLGLVDFRKGLQWLIDTIPRLTSVRTIWMLQDPVAESLLVNPYKDITNKEIDRYNDVALKTLPCIHDVEIWRSNRLIAQRMGFPTLDWHCPKLTSSVVSKFLKRNDSLQKHTDANAVDSAVLCTLPPPLSNGYHVSAEAMSQNVQILLNLYCNNHMKFDDGTCCRSAEPITTVQKRCFIFIGICLVASILCYFLDILIRGRWISCPRLSRAFGVSRVWPSSDPFAIESTSRIYKAFHDFRELTSALAKFGLILIYFFICDRTVLFMKTNKGFTIMSFLLPLTYISILGFFFSGPTVKTRLNHVDITREWKGWMQAYLLIYHFTGSYRVVPLYTFTRYLISAYLFLSGFGHFHYLWHRALPNSLLWYLIPYRFSLRDLCSTLGLWWQMTHRYMEVIYRLNFFVFALCLVMNRNYMFYYFVPLISFWFTITMLLILVIPRVSAFNRLHQNTTSATHTTPAHTNNPKPVTPPSYGESRMDPTSDIQKTNSLLSIDMTSASASASPPIIDNCAAAGTSSTHQPIFNRHTHDTDCKSSPTSPGRPEHRGFVTALTLAPLGPGMRASHSYNSIDRRGHQKTLSLGTGCDIRRMAEKSHRGPVLIRGAEKWITVTKSGPPWTEDLMRKVRSVVPIVGGSVSGGGGGGGGGVTRRYESDRSGISVAQNRLWSLGWRCLGFRCSSNKNTNRAVLGLSFPAVSRRLRISDAIMVIKIVLLIVAIEVVYSSESIFRAIFFSGPQRSLFQQGETAPNPMQPYTNDDPQNWRTWTHYWSIDRFTVIYGILFALFCEWARRTGSLTDGLDGDIGLPRSVPENLDSSEVSSTNSTVTTSYRSETDGGKDEMEQDNISFHTSHTSGYGSTAPVTGRREAQRTRSNCIDVDCTVEDRLRDQENCTAAYTPQFPTAPFQKKYRNYGVLSKITCRRFTSILLTTLGLIGIGLSILFAFNCKDRVTCAQWHPFICLLPIISYMLIRNSLGVVRRSHSILFAWFGDISLEVFIAQHHIWLAADGNGILVLLPGYPLLNLALTSFVFICICCEVHKLTDRLRRFLVPETFCQLIRNAILIGLTCHLIIGSGSHVTPVTSVA